MSNVKPLKRLYRAFGREDIATVPARMSSTIRWRG